MCIFLFLYKCFSIAFFCKLLEFTLIVEEWGVVYECESTWEEGLGFFVQANFTKSMASK